MCSGFLGCPGCALSSQGTAVSMGLRFDVNEPDIAKIIDGDDVRRHYPRWQRKEPQKG